MRGLQVLNRMLVLGARAPGRMSKRVNDFTAFRHFAISAIPPSSRGRRFPMQVTGFLSRGLIRFSDTRRRRCSRGRVGGFLGFAQGFQPGGLFSLGEKAGLVVRHRFGSVAGLDFLFLELEFRPFTGFFRRRCQCCFLFFR
jgi:hypothetical protein